MRQTLALGASKSRSPTLKVQKRRPSFAKAKTPESSDSTCSRMEKFPQSPKIPTMSPHHRIDCIAVPLTFGIRQDAMFLSPVATDIRFCNLTLYTLYNVGLNKILLHQETMFGAPRGLGSSESF